jgi:hypothetical protein
VQAGPRRITLAVTGLDALLVRLAAQQIEHEPIETYSNGVRHVNNPRSGWERDRVRRGVRRRERGPSIGRAFVIDAVRHRSRRPCGWRSGGHVRWELAAVRCEEVRQADLRDGMTATHWSGWSPTPNEYSHTVPSAASPMRQAIAGSLIRFHGIALMRSITVEIDTNVASRTSPSGPFACGCLPGSGTSNTRNTLSPESSPAAQVTTPPRRGDRCR